MTQIRQLHWGRVGDEADRGVAGALFALWPEPVGHDQCFQAAGFTAFDDSDDPWDADFDRLAERLVAALAQLAGPPVESAAATAVAGSWPFTGSGSCPGSSISCWQPGTIAAWPGADGLDRSHRVDEQRRRQLEAAAAQWDEHGRGVRGLLDPIELVEAAAWQQTESARQLGRSAEVNALNAASRLAQTMQHRRHRMVAGGVGLLGVATVAVAAAHQVAGLEPTVRAEVERLARALCRRPEIIATCGITPPCSRPPGSSQ